MKILAFQGVNGSIFGFCFGNLISEPIMCLVVAQFILYCIYFGGGAFANYQGNPHLLQQFFTVISPFKYATEIMTAIMLDGLHFKSRTMEVFDMNYGDDCVGRLGVFFLFWFLFAWTALWYRSKRL